MSAVAGIAKLSLDVKDSARDTIGCVDCDEDFPES